MNEQGFPWDAWMETAFVVLGLSSDEFWNMSVREWRCALSGLGAAVGTPMGRDALDALCGAYPDEKA